MIENEKEFRLLLNSYKKVTIFKLKKIEKVVKTNKDPRVNLVTPVDCLSELTGFGAVATCSLCKPLLIKDLYNKCDCSKCIWALSRSKLSKSNRYFCIDTKHYKGIMAAKTNSELIKNLRLRANYMEKILKEKLNCQK